MSVELKVYLDSLDSEIDALKKEREEIKIQMKKLDKEYMELKAKADGAIDAIARLQTVRESMVARSKQD